MFIFNFYYLHESIIWFLHFGRSLLKVLNKVVKPKSQPMFMLKRYFSLVSNNVVYINNAV